MAKKFMFFIDFDGTITKEDMCLKLVDTFARTGWKEINHKWEQGEISTEECAARTLALISAGPEELETFFNTADIDITFPPFVRWAEEKKYPIIIVSDGYDNYIAQTLNRYNLKIPYYANHLFCDGGKWKMSCLGMVPKCEKCGVCKTGIIESLLQPEFISVYIGDGYSDTCPIEFCDLVFAQKTLADYCEKSKIPYYRYNSFEDVMEKIEELHY